MQTIFQDLRYGARMLAKKPGFTFVAVITLALGIGANSAIFSVVNGLLLRPLPYRDSDRLAIIWTHSPGANVAQDWPSPGQFSAIASRNTVFEELALAQGGSVSLTGQGVPQRLGAISTSSVLFSLLGAQALIGRTFLPEEDSPGKPPTAILSYGFWQRQFGGDPNVIDQVITVDGEKRSIVGIMPRDFTLSFEVMPTVGTIDQADLLLPLPLGADRMAEQGDENYNILARLKPGVTIAQAQAELDAAVQGLAEGFPKNYPPSRQFSFSITPLLEQVVGDVRPILLVLLGAVGCVLLIACANVANLLLTRAAGREREMAIREAMGAGRWRVVRQLLTESVLLAAVGGALGLLVAIWTLEGLRWLNPGNIPRLQNVALDGRALAFTSVVSLFTGILFGLAPALRSARVNLSEALKEGGRSLVDTGHQRLRKTLVIAEMALSLVLLIAAGLLIRSFVRVQHVEPGFSPHNVLSLHLSLEGTGYLERTRRPSFYQQLWERIRRVPGVEAAGAASVLPLSGAVSWGSITIEDYVPPSGESAIQADQRIASVGYFETMKIPLVSGRFFTDQDLKDAAPVVIIDENMASRYWPGADPVGRRLKSGRAESKTPWATIVGVVANVKQYALDSDSRVALYYAALQLTPGEAYVALRTSGDPAAVAGAVTQEIRDIDPDILVADVKSMDQLVSESLARRRFAMIALSVFALTAMILAAVGIYGVMSYSVTQRTREIGIRMALGAPTRDVLRMVVGNGMVLAGIGVGIGLASAFAATRLMTSLLFGVSATDPLTYVAIAVVLAGVALVACFVPARRATRVDPMIALRYE